MRTMIRVSIPVEAGNKSVKDGSLPKIMSEILERLRPEAAYFGADHGVRTVFLVVDVKDPSEIPSLAEPFFMGFNAKVEFLPVMNADDLKRGLSKLS
jgi:hypothetical protein